MVSLTASAIRDGQAVRELQLGERADRRLLHDVRPPRGGPHHRVVDVEVAVDEDPLARHLDVVEDHERVLLVEAGRQRTVERVGAGRATRCRGTGRSSPGVSIGIEKLSAYGGRWHRAAADGRGRRRSRRRTAPAWRGCGRRARRCRARCRRPCAAAPGCRRTTVSVARSIVGWTIVWVRRDVLAGQLASGRLTRLVVALARCGRRDRATRCRSPAKPANVTFM